MNDKILHQARETLERAEDAARDSLEVAVDAAEDGMDAARRFITRQAHERPLAVIGVAAGVGLLLGLILSSGRRD